MAKVDPGRLHDLHMIMPSISRSEHLDLFIGARAMLESGGSSSLASRRLRESDISLLRLNPSPGEQIG